MALGVGVSGGSVFLALFSLGVDGPASLPLISFAGAFLFLLSLGFGGAVPFAMPAASLSAVAFALVRADLLGNTCIARSVGRYSDKDAIRRELYLNGGRCSLKIEFQEAVAADV